MANPIIEQLFRQNLWANLTIIDALEDIGEPARTMNAPGTYGTPWETMVHILASEWSYAHRIGALGDTPMPASWTPSHWNELREVAKSNTLGFLTVIDQAVGNPVPSVETHGETHRDHLSLFLIQAYSHGVEHRGQIKVVVSSHGIEPPDLSGWSWIRWLESTTDDRTTP